MKNESFSPSPFSILRARLQLHRAKSHKYKNPVTQSNAFWGGTPFQVSQNCGYRSTWGRWSENCDEHARFTGLAHKIVRLNHTGWYTDEDGMDDTARGVVYLLPHGRYIAAMADPWQADKDGYGPCVIECTSNGQPVVYDDKEDAARAADKLAEIYAEGEREYRRKEDTRAKLETDMGDAQRALAELRSDARGLVSGIRESKLSPSFCDRLKKELLKMRDKMHAEYRDMMNAKKELAALCSLE